MNNGPALGGASGKLSGSWVGSVDLQSIAATVGTPVFIYSEEQLVRNVTRIYDAAAAAGLAHRVEVFVPFFPNSNPHVLRPLQDMGVGLLLQLPSEYKILEKFGFDKFIVSPGHVSDEEIAYWGQLPYPVFLSSMGEVEFALHINAPSISVRIDSLDSGKPGIKYDELPGLVKLLAKHDRDIECFEVYCGSGNSRDEMTESAETLFTIFAKYFPAARSVDFAGGHGFAYSEWNETDKHFDWLEYLKSLGEIANRMNVPEHVKLMFEPARDLLADIGTMLVGVKRNLISNPVQNLVVTDGSRMLIPSAQLRNRQHNIVFLDPRMNEIVVDDSTGYASASVRGRTILRNDYLLPGEYEVPANIAAGDFMLVLDTGAYCATQHMEFLNVPPVPEVVIGLDGGAQLATARGDELDKWRYLLQEKVPLRRLVG